jgi:hypothetical protein
MIPGRAIPLTSGGADVALLEAQLRARPRGGRIRWAAVARRLLTTLYAVLTTVVAGGTVWLRASVEERVATAAPSVVAVDVYRLFVDDTPVLATLTAGWEKVTEWTTHDAVQRDPTLWRRMYVDDWDRLPAGLRERGLDAMMARYRYLLLPPATWDRMRTEDWDEVPQPVRALAYRHMAEYWTGYYDVGGAYAIPRELMADTLSAVILSESWFEHRALNVNAWGNRDLGLAHGLRRRASPHDLAVRAGPRRFRAQRRGLLQPVARNAVCGVLDRPPPRRARWRSGCGGSRVPSGNPAGIGRARGRLPAGRRGRRRQYIRNPGGTSAWAYLWRRDRQIRDEEWPWMTVAGRAAALFKRDEVKLATTITVGLAR